MHGENLKLKEYTQFDTITPAPPSRYHTPNFLFCIHLLSQNNFFNSTVTVVILNNISQKFTNLVDKNKNRCILYSLL